MFCLTDDDNEEDGDGPEGGVKRKKKVRKGMFECIQTCLMISCLQGLPVTGTVVVRPLLPVSCCPVPVQPYLSGHSHTVTP